MQGMFGIDPSGQQRQIPVDAFGIPKTTNSAGTGVDYSSARPAFPPAGLTLLTTISLNNYRSGVEVQNQSAATITVVRDDGSGTQLSYILLAGTGAGAPGGSWNSKTFRGRVRVYGASGAQVSAFED